MGLPALIENISEGTASHVLARCRVNTIFSKRLHFIDIDSNLKLFEQQLLADYTIG